MIIANVRVLVSAFYNPQYFQKVLYTEKKYNAIRKAMHHHVIVLGPGGARHTRLRGGRGWGNPIQMTGQKLWYSI
jgi:hypothetical protein